MVIRQNQSVGIQTRHLEAPREIIDERSVLKPQDSSALLLSETLRERVHQSLLGVSPKTALVHQSLNL